MTVKSTREEVESFFTSNGKREIVLCRIRGVPHINWMIEVYISKGGVERTLLSTSEYQGEVTARQDFEMRRPKMRESFEEVPMQRGKRLVQEMLQEKLK